MLEHFSLIDLSDLGTLAMSEVPPYQGCGSDKGRCNNGCGCGVRNGQCGGWTGSTPIRHEPGTGGGGTAT